MEQKAANYNVTNPRTKVTPGDNGGKSLYPRKVASPSDASKSTYPRKSSSVSPGTLPMQRQVSKRASR